MAYEHNWNPKDKLTYEQLVEQLTPIVVELTDNAFAFRKWSARQDSATTPTPV